uniref:Uncharacterized protein n=1 Tax=Anguilla anguilla TaxID=7936 RepID=A0A0E9V0H1_ANGAN
MSIKGPTKVNISIFYFT